jgi:cell division inhibitor SepF
MNFFGRKSGRFGDGDGFYEPELEKTETLEEVAEPAEESTPVLEPATQSVGFGGGSLELKVMHSEKYEDVVTVAEHLLDHCIVVLDLNAANKEVRRRILDFLSGVVYSIGGQVRRVSENTYVIKPSNVDLSESHVAAPVNEV